MASTEPTASRIEAPDDAPDYDAVERQRIRRTQLRALPVAILGTSIIFAVGYSTGYYWMMVPAALGILGFVSAYVCVRAGLIAASTFLIVFTAVGLVTQSGLTGEGLRDPATLAYPVIIIWAGMTLRQKPFMGSLVLVAFSTVLLAANRAANWIPMVATSRPAASAPLTVAIILIATAIAVSMLAKTASDALRTAREEVERRRETERELRELAIRDSLTGLFNRRFFDAEMARLESTRNVPVSIIAADVVGLKDVNDKQGHAAGDRLLAHVAGVLSAAVRAEDVLARMGGDEFSILLPDTDELAAENAVARIRSSIAASASSSLPDVALSLGTATSYDGGLTETLRLADERLCANKAEQKSATIAVVGASSPASMVSRLLDSEPAG